MSLKRGSFQSGCVTLGEILNLSELHCPLLPNRIMVAAAQACWNINYKTATTWHAYSRSSSSQDTVPDPFMASLKEFLNETLLADMPPRTGVGQQKGAEVAWSWLLSMVGGLLGSRVGAFRYSQGRGPGCEGLPQGPFRGAGSGARLKPRIPRRALRFSAKDVTRTPVIS